MGAVDEGRCTVRIEDIPDEGNATAIACSDLRRHVRGPFAIEIGHRDGCTRTAEHQRRRSSDAGGAADHETWGRGEVEEVGHGWASSALWRWQDGSSGLDSNRSATSSIISSWLDSE